MSEAADDTLRIILRTASFSRCINAMMSLSSHRNPAIRGKAANYILILISLHSSNLRGSKEITALLPKLSKMLSDHTPEARYSTRHIIRSLLSSRLVSREEMEQYMSAEDIAKAFDKSLDSPWQTGGKVDSSSFANKTKSALLGTVASSVYKVPVTISALQLPQNSSTESRGRIGRRKLEEGVVSGADGKALVADLQREVSSSEWSARIEALNKLTSAIFKVLDSDLSESSSKLILSCFDLVLERLEDGNVKVCLHALGCVQSILNRADAAVLPSPAVVLRCLLNSSSASNK